MVPFDDEPDGLSGRDWLHLLDTSDRLDRHAIVPRWQAPSGVDLDGERLVYRNGPGRLVTSPPSLLTDFILLAESSAEAVLKFAQRCGVLWLCNAHGLPLCHSPDPPCAGPLTGQGLCFPRGWHSKERAEESVVRWHQLARHARSILNVAAEMQQGRMGRAQDWDLLTTQDFLNRVSRRPRNADERWIFLMHLVDRWCEVGRVRPYCVLVPGKKVGKDIPYTLGIKFGGGLGAGLFGALAIQLLLAVSSTKGLAVCSHCGRAYQTKRRPNPNRRTYCERCRRAKADKRDASRDYSRRQREIRM